MKRKIYGVILITMGGLLWGCYPNGAEYTEELDLVYSNYDKAYDFQGKATYSLPNKIVKITGKDNQPPEYIDDKYGIPMLAQIDANMKALGWSKVDVSAGPDIQFLPAAWSSTTIIYGGWGGYWCWYYPYYCGGGGWYYPYYPTYSYTSGTLLMTIVDQKTPSTDGSNRVVWTGAINGLLTGSYSATRINNAIDQSFKQSPYLKTN